jgi:hypothetical protein
MIIPSGRVDGSLDVHLQKIYKTAATGTVARLSRSDVVTISRFSALVEHGRACALALPEVRADVVARARESLLTGAAPAAGEVASAMINAAVEGQV